jgi:hypothetical protein
MTTCAVYGCLTRLGTLHLQLLDPAQQVELLRTGVEGLIEYTTVEVCPEHADALGTRRDGYVLVDIEKSYGWRILCGLIRNYPFALIPPGVEVNETSWEAQ